MLVRAWSPMRLRRAETVMRVSRWRASSLVLPGGARRPSWPWRMISRTPGATSKATQGTAVVMASMGASGKPSPRELSTNTEAWRSAPGTSVVRPIHCTLSAMPSRALCFFSAASSSPAP
ncbi:hypothetical protein A6A06_21100 [Streptomyces sp. CB02923]|nr:hypothetical protein A6A06_21100 [Streptomyces sp. CB02923]